MSNKVEYQISKTIKDEFIEIAMTGKVAEFDIPILQEELNPLRFAEYKIGC